MITDDFISYLKGVKRYSARTAEIYALALEEFVSGLSDMDGNAVADDSAIIKSLTPTMIRNHEVYLTDKRKLNPRTVGLHLSAIGSFCRYLMSMGLLKSNPARPVKRPKCDKRLPVFFRRASMDTYFKSTEAAADKESFHELETLAGCLKDGADRGSSTYKAAEDLYGRRLRRLIINILYETGIRRAELVGLRIGDIDAGRKMIRITGKGDKMREIPLTASLCEEISLYLRAAETIAGRKRTAGEPLLVTMGGTALYPVFVDRTVKGELGGVDGISGRKSPHVLRHTIATELLNDGTDLYSIKEMLGHSSLAATQVYTHNTVEKLKNIYSQAHPRAKRGGKNGD